MKNQKLSVVLQVLKVALTAAYLVLMVQELRDRWYATQEAKDFADTQ